MNQSNLIKIAEFPFFNVLPQIPPCSQKCGVNIPHSRLQQIVSILPITWDSTMIADEIQRIRGYLHQSVCFAEHHREPEHGQHEKDQKDDHDDIRDGDAGNVLRVLSQFILVFSGMSVQRDEHHQHHKHREHRSEHQHLPVGTPALVPANRRLPISIGHHSGSLTHSHFLNHVDCKLVIHADPDIIVTSSVCLQCLNGMSL